MRDRYTGRFFDDDMDGGARRRYDEDRHEEARYGEQRRFDDPQRYGEQRRYYDEPQRYDQQRRFEEPRRIEEPHWRREMQERWARNDHWRPDRDRDRWTEGQPAPYGMGRPQHGQEMGQRRTWIDEGRVELGPRYEGSFVPQRTDQPRRYPRGPKGYRRSDERVREDVCDRLYHSLDLDSSDVEVRVQNGEVILTGSVPDRSMKYRIESMIEDVSGVIDVTNQIRVKQQQYGREWNDQGADGTPENGRRPSANMPRS
jgi:hypothetical protein